MRLIDADKVNTNYIIVFGDKPMTQKDFDHAVISLLHVQQTIDPETLQIVQELREQLAKVTAERDAAVEDLYEVCDCETCKNTDCVPRGRTGKCRYEWKGLKEVKEDE